MKQNSSIKADRIYFKVVTRSLLVHLLFLLLFASADSFFRGDFKKGLPVIFFSVKYKERKTAACYFVGGFL